MEVDPLSENKKSIFRKTILTGCTVLLIAGAALYALDHKEPQKSAPEPQVVRPVKIMALKAAGAAAPITVNGQVEAAKKVDLAFQVPGKLASLDVKPGQKVTSGDVVARLDPAEFRDSLNAAESALQSARSRLKAMKSGARPETIAALKSQLASAKAALDDARDQHERYKKLYSEEAVAKATLEQYETKWKQAGAAVNVAEKKLQEARRGARKEDVKAMEAKIGELTARRDQARKQLDHTTLKAPFSGVIARKYMENFQVVQPRQPVVSLQDTSKLEVVADVPANAMAPIAAGRTPKITVTFDAVRDKSFSADIRDYAEKPDPVTQTYPVTLKVTTPEETTLMPGMSSSVTLTPQADHNETFFLVPTDALSGNESGDRYVWLLDEDKDTVSKVPVTTGDLSGQSVAVRGKLREGQKIVTAGVDYLRQGEKVRIMTTTEN